MDKILSILIIPVHAAKFPSAKQYKINKNSVGKGSQTRAMSARTLQAYGNGKGVPLTGNAEGEEIVETL